MGASLLAGGMAMSLSAVAAEGLYNILLQDVPLMALPALFLRDTLCLGSATGINQFSIFTGKSRQLFEL